MKELLLSIVNEMKAGREVVLVTVVASSGSVPRGSGARMAVGRDGRLAGTIGGGQVEYEAEQRAARLLDEKASDSHSFLLKPNEVQDLGMVCGGSVTLFFQFIAHDRTAAQRLFEQAISDMDKTETKWLATTINQDNSWQMCLADRHGPAGLPPGLLQNSLAHSIVGDVQYFAEPLVGAGFVYVFGGGHVAQELVPVLQHVGFRCVVFEDRPEFAEPALFPSAEKIILGDFQSIADQISITGNDYAVVVTRGHRFDYDVQKQVLGTPAYYIGVIGSRSKTKFVSAQLMEDGFTEEDLKRIHTPIGLSIKAETPAEIAISIAAEMILERARNMI